MDLKKCLYDLATDRIRGFPALPIKLLLFILSLIYGLSVICLIGLRGMFKTRLKVKVISVGNITLGGTGKTVMVELIARYLKKEGRKTAILSRGYKKPSGARGFPPDSYEEMGDEPFMLSRKIPGVAVLVGPDRLRSAKNAISRCGADTLVLDDGLQQWWLRKDLEIVMLDARRPFGNGKLIPRGILRQPVFTLRNADVFVLTNAFGTELNKTREALLRINPRALIVTAVHLATGLYRLNSREKLLAADYLKGQTVSLFCGLGNPGSFRDLCLATGMKEGLFFEFPDHYRFEEEDIERMVRVSRDKGIVALVTTEKDAVRIPLAARKRFGNDIFVLAVELELKDEKEGFYNRLRALYPA